MTTDLHTRILALLEGSGIPFDHFEHEHVHTSHEAARARGTRIQDAAKALVFETGSGKLVECVVSGHRRVDLKKLKALLGEKNIALASPERVLHVTGCTVGSVPPFGNTFSPPLPMYVDQEVLTRERIVFSAGSHYHSIRMRPEDWVKLVNPVVADLRKEGR
jgi:Ala-tRNA(Pro) deacylase